MSRHGIPTAAYAAFTELEPALAYLRQLPIDTLKIEYEKMHGEQRRVKTFGKLKQMLTDENTVGHDIRIFL